MTEETPEETPFGYRLSSGREFHAPGGFVSITRDWENHDAFLIGGGLDDLAMRDDEKWTSEERIELAHFMIAQWTEFLDNAVIDRIKEAVLKPEPPAVNCPWQTETGKFQEEL